MTIVAIHLAILNPENSRTSPETQYRLESNSSREPDSSSTRFLLPHASTSSSSTSFSATAAHLDLVIRILSKVVMNLIKYQEAKRGINLANRIQQAKYIDIWPVPSPSPLG
ncbi:hypothetical protein H5410_019841 [Solanum commersonii]|uniref:Uncharacterized protein n=1 Tax=Solanum commersonii TaxID=4109 RepID=A0A9J5Z9G9_SOLCO|nr:hypothetical protein H5410_019841 [Solanum commersonii]